MAGSLMSFSLKFALIVLFTLNNESLASFSSSQTEHVLRTYFKGPIRNKRQQCVDGNYQHDGNTCCLCPAGQRVLNHCTGTSETKCEICEKNSYNNEPNSHEKCQPCTSCTQPIANLEVEERCTPARDTKCRCKKGHYCDSKAQNCKLCHSCQTCESTGIKQECTATNNTVCNDENKGDIIAGIIIGVLVLLIVVAIGIWMKKRMGNPIKDQEQPTDPSIPLLRVDLQPHIADVAEVLGWNDMKDIARRSEIPKGISESCQQNHPGNSQEQTRELLEIWVERAGKDGSVKLINILREKKLNTKADKVQQILESDAKRTDESTS